MKDLYKVYTVIEVAVSYSLPLQKYANLRQKIQK